MVTTMRGFAFTIILCYIKGVLSQQKFVTTPSLVVVAPGHNTTLACLVQNMGGECRWQKDGKPVGMYPGKYSLAQLGTAGDCSLTISSVDLRLDDGEWECQVTSTSFTTQDALASSSTRLTVQVPPASIKIQALSPGSKDMLREGDMITVTEDKLETITCMTRHSNPAPFISWQLGNQLLLSTQQTNTSEEEEADSGKWRSEAVLTHSFVKSDAGKQLWCIVKHAAYPGGEKRSSAMLDVLYKPTVNIVRVDSPVLEDGLGSVSLTCTDQSNPPARVTWSKVGDTSGPHHTKELQLNPIRRQQAGTYICQAENSVGRSEPKQTVVEVLYTPIITSTQPLDKVSVMVHNRTVLTCTAEGNPAPKYQWIQTLSSTAERKRSYTAELVIEDVGYEDQGEYKCVAINVIGGERREEKSEAVKVEVTGVPQVVKQVGEVVGIHGSDVRLEAEFCSDPMPIENTWEWGGVVLPSGSEVDGRYKAELLSHPHMEDCYISRLTVRRAGKEDSMRYIVRVENEHGQDTVPVLLNVKAPVPLASVIAAASVLSISLLLLLITFILLRRNHKLCFKDNLSEKEASLGQNTYSKGDSRLSLVNETKEINTAKAVPPSTKV